MHAVNICPRDLKIENLRMYYREGDAEENVLKICDLGDACFFDVDEQTGEPGKIKGKVGETYYASPQVMMGTYTCLADDWATGVIMYILMTGYPPFAAPTAVQILDKVRTGNFTFTGDLHEASDECKDVLRGLLRISEGNRMRTDQAYQSEFIEQQCPRSNQIPLRSTLVNSLRRFTRINKLKKAGLFVIAGLLTEDNLQPNIESFINMDVEGDGTLGSEEVYNALVRADAEIPDDLEQIFIDLDTDGSGRIEYTEFLAATLQTSAITEDVIWSCFRSFDQNGDGLISQTEMYTVLNQRCDEDAEGVSAQEVVKLMAELSSDGDTYVDFNEFYHMIVHDHVKTIKPH
jgi:calcium-dependent protein kinase